MKKEIKQRIEQIKKRGALKGYRHSRAGLCPSDWRKGVLSDVLYNEQRAVKKPEEAYWRLGIRSHAKGTFHEFAEDPETVDMDELYVVRENDLVVNITFAWEHAVALADKNDDGLLVSHRFPTYVFKEGQNPFFYKSIVIQKRFKELLALISPGGAGRNRVMSKKDFLRLPCNIPPFAEQTRIAEILMQCDKVIELKQKLIDETKKLKKVLLRKMFLRKGENVPEIRFSGYTAPWEQRKLGELYESSCSGGTPTSSIERYYNGDIPFLGIADIISRTVYETKKHISEEGLNNSTAVMIPTGTVSLAMYASVGKVGITGVPMATSQAFYNMTFASETVRDYVYTMLEKMELFSEWEPLISTGTQRNLNADKVKNKVITVPSEAEMKLIGNLFTNLDNLITLHQRELEEWKNKKKALMQLLLTGIVRVNI